MTKPWHVNCTQYALDGATGIELLQTWPLAPAPQHFFGLNAGGSLQIKRAALLSVLNAGDIVPKQTTCAVQHVDSGVAHAMRLTLCTEARLF